MDEIKLKFCPFCGKSTKMLNRVNSKGQRVYAAECKNCNAKSNWYTEPQYAAQSWNSRVTGFTNNKQY